MCICDCGWAGRQLPCITVLSLAIMLQWLPVKLPLIWFSCVANLRAATCAIFHQSHEMEISIRESSRRNLAGIFLYNILVCEWCPKYVAGKYLLQISGTYPDIHISHLYGISSVSETHLSCQSMFYIDWLISYSFIFNKNFYVITDDILSFLPWDISWLYISFQTCDKNHFTYLLSYFIKLLLSIFFIFFEYYLTWW